MSNLLYLLPTGLFFAVYLIWYAIPLIRRFVMTGFSKDLQELKRRVSKEATLEAERIQSGSDEEKEAEDSETRKTNMERLVSRALSTDFDNTLVREAVEQLRVRYPLGNYRNFEVERLPAYAAYTERLTAARNMAGLFVLCGLLGTMFELEGLVADIGAAAGIGEMASDQFLNNMSAIMGSMSGAFTSSIIGLLLMIIVLSLIGIGDRMMMQPKLDRLDETIQGEVIEDLTEIQRVNSPDLSIGDLIEQTGGLLTDFNSAIDDLSEGMVTSLSKLSGRIEEMMQEFGSFQEQYAQLNDLIVQLRSYGEDIGDVTKAIESAARTLQNPIAEFNQELTGAIESHSRAVEQALDSQTKDRQSMQRDIKRVQDETRQALQDLRGIVESHLKQNDKLSERVDSHIKLMESQNKQHREATADALQKRVKMLSQQNAHIEKALSDTADALRAADSQSLAKVIESLEEQMASTASQLDGTTSRLKDTAKKLERSAGDLSTASTNLRNASDEPVTAFDWVNRSVKRLRSNDK